MIQMKSSVGHTVPLDHSGVCQCPELSNDQCSILKYRAEWNRSSHPASAHTGRRPGINLHCDLHAWWATTHLSIKTKATLSSSTGTHVICQVKPSVLKVTWALRRCQSKCWTPFDAAFTNSFNEELIFSPLFFVFFSHFFGRGKEAGCPSRIAAAGGSSVP